MFDFLREIKDNIEAEVTLMSSENTSNIPVETILHSVNSDDKDYLNAMGYKYGNIYPTMMKKIITNNLQHLDPEVIATKLNISLYTKII